MLAPAVQGQRSIPVDDMGRPAVLAWKSVTTEGLHKLYCSVCRKLPEERKRERERAPIEARGGSLALSHSLNERKKERESPLGYPTM